MWSYNHNIEQTSGKADVLTKTLQKTFVTNIAVRQKKIQVSKKKRKKKRMEATDEI